MIVVNLRYHVDCIGDIARRWQLNVVIEEHPSIVIESEKIVVFGEYYPPLSFGVGTDFLVGSIIRQYLLRSDYFSPVSTGESIHISLKRTSITENSYHGPN